MLCWRSPSLPSGAAGSVPSSALLVLQGLAAGTFPIVIGSHTGDTGLIVVGVAVMILRSGVLPWVVNRSLPSQRPTTIRVRRSM